MDPKKDRRKIFLGIGGVAVAMTLCMAGAFWISGLLFRLTGAPPPLAQFLISCWVGFTLFWLFASGLHAVMQRTQHEGRDSQRGKVLDAMAQIASGDFSVFIPPEDSDVYHDIAEGLNKMAKNLGNLETMRQDFISNVSHEIQSPLTSINGFAALLQNEELPGDQRRHYAAIIEAESKRLSSLSENLLKLSTLEADDASLLIGEYRLDKQIETIALTMEPQWSAKNISVEADLTKTFYRGDEGLLSQVWGNLLHNAVKFTPEGKTIYLSLKSDSQNVHFIISDTGTGIPEEDQIHIFERFYKVDKSRDRSLGGNGLGLSIVKKIVELHGGRITVESEAGKGTTFQIFLPHLHSV